MTCGLFLILHHVLCVLAIDPGTSTECTETPVCDEPGRYTFAQGLHGCNSTIHEHCLWWRFQGKGTWVGQVAITNDMSLANVMLVQSLQYNFISVRNLASVGYDTLFGLTSVKVFRRDTLKVAFLESWMENFTR